jgi:hypothetical protein
VSEARKHHVVPAFYLKRWEKDCKVLVVDKDLRKSYRAGATTIARRTDYYRLDEEVFTEGDPLEIERILGAVEGLMAETIVDLVDRDCVLDENHVDALAMFYATWVFRSEEYRARLGRTVSALIESGTITGSDVKGAEWMAGAGASSMLLWSAKDFERLRDGLVQRRWILVKTPPVLIASDTPNRWREHRPKPLLDVFLPLAPDHVVVAVPDGVAVPKIASLVQVAEWNRTLVQRSRRWVFDGPDRRTALSLVEAGCGPIVRTWS